MVEHRSELGQPLVARYHLLAGHVPAPLRPHLVLEEQAGGAGGLPQLDGAHRVEGVAVAGVGVDDDHRLGHRRADAAGHLGHLDLREHAHVGAPEQRAGHGEAGEEHDLEAGACRQPRRQRIPHAGHEHRLAGRQSRSQIVTVHGVTVAPDQRHTGSRSSHQASTSSDDE